jgi:phosphate:Na+ symporter
MDNRVDGLDEAIKLCVTKLTRDSLDERESKRAMEIVSFAINLEHIGDIIDKNLSELATKKIKRRFQFSTEGAEELSAFHKRTMDSLYHLDEAARSGGECQRRSSRTSPSFPHRTRVAAPG